MIEIINQQNKYAIRLKTFRNLLEKLVEHYKLKDPEVTLAFVDNTAIKQLNFQYLKRNVPTDVLSFPINERGSDDKYYLGDIIISVPYAFKQCFPKKHGLERKLEILTVHGFLHLLGYEHFEGMEEEEKKIHGLLLAGENGN